jgi:rRNA maturation endonuclease Nob1
MSLFRDLGKKAEKFKQQMTESTDATYQCEACGAEMNAEYEECPECGSDEIRRVE